MEVASSRAALDYDKSQEDPRVQEGEGLLSFMVPSRAVALVIV